MVGQRSGKTAHDVEVGDSVEEMSVSESSVEKFDVSMPEDNISSCRVTDDVDIFSGSIGETRTGTFSCAESIEYR